MTHPRTRNAFRETPMADATMDQAYASVRGLGCKSTGQPARPSSPVYMDDLWSVVRSDSSIISDNSSISNRATADQREGNGPTNAERREGEREAARRNPAHLSNMDQALKNILNYGAPKSAQIMVPANRLLYALSRPLARTASAGSAETAEPAPATW
jgi:hypothetical protein